MLNIDRAVQTVSLLGNTLPFLNKIETKTDHEFALELIEKLLPDYDKNLFMINSLSHLIEEYEESAEEFESFNKSIQALTPGVATLSLLMDQHSLKTADFKNEIGGKSMVSMILNGKRTLSLLHINKLAIRFSVSPSLFV